MKALTTIAVTTVFATVSTACSGVPYRARPAPVLSAQVTNRGSAIYVGMVYPRHARPGTPPTFVYQRRVDDRGADLLSTHVTRDLTGRIAIAESASHSPTYALHEYTLHANQLGQRGSIKVDGDRVTFRVTQDGGKERVRVEKQSAPVVTGPTLVGYIAQHLGELREGKTLSVAMGVLDRLETIGFRLQKVGSQPEQTSIRMRPSSWLVRLVMDPIYFTFDGSGKLTRIEGLVPPKVHRSTWRGELWDDFDARVEYTYVADAYR